MPLELEVSDEQEEEEHGYDERTGREGYVPFVRGGSGRIGGI